MKCYVVDAFTDTVFKGNSAAICVMGNWFPDVLMQKIAKENNLSETAFAVREEKGYKLRWFTPGGEVDLCGHATLATAFVLMNYVDTSITEVHFQTLSGELIVNKKDDLYEMDFPAYQLKSILLPGLLLHLTAASTEYDCVSRSFAPKLNVPEDPVCGSGHCHIAPLWSDKLKKTELIARQVSHRGGTLYCRVGGGRVQLAGKAILYSIAELFLPECREI
jgi:predicted PhzF superfamily epimerase YddE/YHI9